jgi:hypothetical protein
MKTKNHLCALVFGVAGILVLPVMNTMRINHLAAQNAAVVGKDQKPQTESVVLVLSVLGVAVVRVLKQKIGVLIGKLMIGILQVLKGENLRAVTLIDHHVGKLATRMSFPDPESAGRLQTQVHLDPLMMMQYQLNTYHITR